MLKMAFPRMFASVVVVLLIGIISAAGIFAVMVIGPALAHGTGVEHVAGKVVAVTGLDRDFKFKTTDGQSLTFECRGSQCRATLGHLERHIIEKANTDVYFKMVPGSNTLVALDAD